MLADELVACWPERWPRPTIGSTKNSTSQVKPFGRDFAGREVATITREEFRRWALDNPGRARYVRTMLYDALDAGLVEENVAAGVKIPKRRAKAIDPPAGDELDQLVEAAETFSLPVGAMITVAAFTGLREGELRALTVGDVTMDGPNPTRINVHHALNRREEVVPPKTESSHGIIAVLPPARARLRDHYLWANGDSSRIFPYTRNQRQAGWHRARKLAGVDCRWHDLRHFCATYLLDAGATMDDVALQLRCSVDEVRKTYGHPDRELALERLEGLVS